MKKPGQIAEREEVNRKALEIVGRLRDIGTLREELLNQLDAYFQIQDACPSLLENAPPIATQWVGFAEELRLRVTNMNGDVSEIPESAVPAIITRPAA